MGGAPGGPGKPGLSSTTRASSCRALVGQLMADLAALAVAVTSPQPCRQARWLEALARLTSRISASSAG